MMTMLLAIILLLFVSGNDGRTHNYRKWTHDRRLLLEKLNRSEIVFPRVQNVDRTQRHLNANYDEEWLNDFRAFPRPLHPEHLTINLKGFGRSFELELTLIHGLFASHDFRVEIDGKTSINTAENCHYKGSIVNEPNSLVRLSTCWGLQGWIASSRDNEIYIVEPGGSNSSRTRNTNPSDQIEPEQSEPGSTVTPSAQHVSSPRDIRKIILADHLSGSGSGSGSNSHSNSNSNSGGLDLSAHLMYKSSDIKKEYHLDKHEACKEQRLQNIDLDTDYQFAAQPPQKQKLKRGRRKRRKPPHRTLLLRKPATNSKYPHQRQLQAETAPVLKTVELWLVLDYSYYEHYGNMALTQAQSTVADVHIFYQKIKDMNSGNPDIRIVLKGLTVMTSPEQQAEIKSVTSSSIISSYLTAFQTWASADWDNRVGNADVANILTKVDMSGGVAGVAYVGTICRTYAVGIIEDGRFPYFTSETMTHEMGHTFNSNHDSDGNSCSERGKIMGAVAMLTGAPDPDLSWSTCSENYIVGKIQSLQGTPLNCLDDHHEDVEPLPTAMPTDQPTAASCTDSLINGEETDLNCGGNDCAPCIAGESCRVDSDCVGNVCDSNICTTRSPTDAPTGYPTRKPTKFPTRFPTRFPTTAPPDRFPTRQPTPFPTNQPTPTPQCTAGACCDLSTHQFQLAGIVCRPALHECDVPERCDGQSDACPENQVKLDFSLCDEGGEQGHCYSGSCVGYDSQCEETFGQMPGIWEACLAPELNNGSDDYMYNGESSYVACGDLTCRRLDDGNDHCFRVRTEGIIKQWAPGTVCGENKICLDSVCVSIDADGGVCVDETCSGHGFCSQNAKKETKCNCDTGYFGASCMQIYAGTIDCDGLHRTGYVAPDHCGDCLKTYASSQSVGGGTPEPNSICDLSMPSVLAEPSSPESTSHEAAIDGDIYTRWVYEAKASESSPVAPQVVVHSCNNFMLTHYSITSSNQEPEQDPSDWSVEVSRQPEASGLDQVFAWLGFKQPVDDWLKVDTQHTIRWSNRHERKMFALLETNDNITNAKAIRRVRFTIHSTRVQSHPLKLQIAEIAIYTKHDSEHDKEECSMSGWAATVWTGVFISGAVVFLVVVGAIAVYYYRKMKNTSNISEKEKRFSKQLMDIRNDDSWIVHIDNTSGSSNNVPKSPISAILSSSEIPKPTQTKQKKNIFNSMIALFTTKHKMVNERNKGATAIAGVSSNFRISAPKNNPLLGTGIAIFHPPPPPPPPIYS